MWQLESHEPEFEKTVEAALLVIHGLLLAEYGGASVLPDLGRLESAMADFQKSETNIYLHAATNAFALTSNHPFIDGNKRTAFAAVAVFLKLNGRQFKDEIPYRTATHGG